MSRSAGVAARGVLCAVACCLVTSALAQAPRSAPAAALARPAAAPATPAAAPAAPTAAAAAAAPGDEKWRASYPFPQCLTTTLSYDVEFVGPLQFVQVGTVRYAYHRFGPTRPAAVSMERASDNPRPNNPLVFIPGLGMSMYIWPVPLLQRLAETREVIIFDNMRTWESRDAGRATLSVPLMANSTMALMTKLGLKQPDVFGWSIGGSVAYALLAYHQNKVGNVIIAAGSPGGPDSYLPPQPVLDAIMSVGNNYTALLPFLFPDGAKDEGVCSMFAAYNSFYASKHTKLVRPLGDKSLQEQVTALVRFAQHASVLSQLERVQNRVLILHGVQDRIVPIRNAALADDYLLGSWMLQLPGEGHALVFSHMRATIFLTSEFLSFANPLTPAEHREWQEYGVQGSTIKLQDLKAAAGSSARN